MMDDCPYCGQPLDEDADDVIDSPRGYAHEDCVQEYERDAEGRRADNAFDLAGDR